MLALHILSEAGPNSSLSCLLLWTLGFFFLMVVVGWLASQNKGNRPDIQREANEQHKDVDGSVKGDSKSPKPKVKRSK